MKALREPLWWLIALFIGLLAGLPYSAPLFSRLFPELPRPVYQQESFWALTLDHGWLVVASSLAATAIGLGAGVAVTRPAGSAFRPLVETIAAIGQTFRRWRCWRWRCRCWALAGCPRSSPSRCMAYCRCCRGRWPGWVRYRLGCQVWLKGWE